MGSVFAYSFSAVMPIILLILIGVLARRTGYLDIDTLRKLNRFNFRYALFALMFVNIYEIESIHNIPVKTAAFVIAVLLILFLFGVFYSRFATNERFRRRPYPRSSCPRKWEGTGTWRDRLSSGAAYLACSRCSRSFSY